jgi:site-specific recombinase XerD
MELVELRKNPLVEEWLAEKRTANTRRTYLMRLRNFLDYHGITPEELLKQPQRKQRSLALRFQNEQPEMNANTIISHLTAVASFLDHYDMPINWKRSRVKPRPDVTSHVFTNGDLYKMFEIADTKQKCMLTLACSLGWEVRGFVTLKRETLRKLVERAKDTGEQFVYFRNVRQKTGALRLGVLNPLALEWTKKWLKIRKDKPRRQRKHQPDRIKPVSDIFDMTSEGINRMLKRLAKKAQIKTTGRVRFHNIRKWVMSGLSRSGFNKWQVKYVLGKAIPLSDATYLQTLEEEVRERYPNAYENYLNLNLKVNLKAMTTLSKEIDQLKDENSELKQRLNAFTLNNEQVQELLRRIEKLEKKAKQE